MRVDVRGLARAFDGEAVLRGVELTVRDGEIVCLLGASGSGKTTLLRIIAGLEGADAGEILLDERPLLASQPVHERDFGLVFQDYALFPHMTVAENVAFGLKMRGQPSAERVREVLTLVGLAGFGGRDVATLSGGEQQRVALARSLAPNPGLLMLDEPLGSLDAALRERLVGELRGIIKGAGLTAIYVTHDQREAFAIADRIAVMQGGRILQIDTPQALYQRPRTAAVARFLGFRNVYSVAAARMAFALAIDGDGAVLLHPDGLSLADDGPIAGNVVERVFLGDVYRLVVRHEGGERVTLRTSARGNVPTVGDAVQVQAADWAVIPLSDDDGLERSNS